MKLPKSRLEWREVMRKAEHGELELREISDAEQPATTDKPIQTQSRQALAATAYIHAGKSHDLLGAPKGRQYIRMDGAHQRDFEHGSVVSNVGFNNNVRVKFDKVMRRLRDDAEATHFVVTSPGGDIFVDALTPKE